MPYSPSPYTTADTVKRLLRTAQNKIRIGDASTDQISNDDLDAFILDGSEWIDSFVRQVVSFDSLPIPNHTEKPEITFAAGRITAYLIHESLYPTYRTEQLGTGVLGWFDEAQKRLDLFVKHVNEGVYTDLSPATGGIQFVTAEQFFQTQIGVKGIRCLVNDQENSTPLKLGNVGPYTDGSDL